MANKGNGAVIALGEKGYALLQAFQHPFTRAQVAAEAPAVHGVTQLREVAAKTGVVPIGPEKPGQDHHRVTIAARRFIQQPATETQGHRFHCGAVCLGKRQQGVRWRHHRLKYQRSTAVKGFHRRHAIHLSPAPTSGTTCVKRITGGRIAYPSGAGEAPARAA